MTATVDAAIGPLDSELLPDIRAHAADLDRGELKSRRSFVGLGAAGLLGVGAPRNAHGALPRMAEIIRRISGECMSTGFSVWAHRMVLEYLLTADTPFSRSAAQPLLAGTNLGVTGMAAAFKDLAGCGNLELVASRVPGGFALSGPIRWASNLYDDSLLVTGARTEDGDKLIVALPLATPGVTVGDHFKLLAMDSTASSYLNLTDAFVPDEQVLSTDFAGFLGAVRPTFLVLQSAMCLGLARTSITQAKAGATGVNEVFAAEVERLVERLAETETVLADAADAVGGAQPPDRKQLLSLRLAAAEIASASAALEIRTAGGKGYASKTPASRRYREAAFIPVQSPSEAQLRWELGRCV
ncbi:acyl-CoA dehydrogenase [Mycobacterium intermedium]|uniref:Acyl-CoA dehydrogenase n=1 Tax=Mycobacterium intermedium TaxID=28445 RepID=A0A1E3S5C6_MYCIE|nr:acyl-CoA dehydrogenase family protein [Mycobacterium intermedium]MCV6966051.1 acyl-CoA/acyl-ACP dehydrogenase [Mycobacterium intermedium]ODQ97300.1 acyl-CoA dehydrogenase [Mycobacterium intermedium]OPE47036.1 acyl-CoA dehydrogenase [Mycobacterium intermedium]ORA96416.1 acyl-CoA dehydrogenase [Mycobacterium intermedium]